MTFPKWVDRENAGALFSEDNLHRYLLWRGWAPDLPRLTVIGLNPSTATATEDDPTIRRCLGFARDWGCGGLMMLNIFAYRSTDPARLRWCLETGRDAGAGAVNDMYIRTEVEKATERGEIVLCAWGAHGTLQRRGKLVTRMLQEYPLWCLGTTSKGEPKHVLYLPADAVRVPYYR